MINHKLNAALIACIAFYPSVLKATVNSKNSVKTIDKQVTICPIHNDTHYLDNIKCELIDHNKPLIKKEYQNQNKHIDRIKKRKDSAKKSEINYNTDWYQEFKNVLENKYKTSYAFDLTYMPQRGAPNGNKTPQQIILSPYLSINPFTDTFLGSGQIQFSYSGIHYWNEEASIMQNRLNIGTGINDYNEDSNQFSQLLYTHTLPGKMNWLSVNVGQYSLYFIDGTSQDFNQQTGLISYSLSQNGSASYPVASLGAYLQFSPNSEWMMQVGFQDANNITGSKINFKTANDGEYTNYMYISWSPTFQENWVGQYMLLSYNQPSTIKQYGDSQGWSFSFSQYFGKIFNVFGRANGSSGNIFAIKKSYVFGAGFKNPFERNQNDYASVAFGINQMSGEALGQSAIHKYENVVELQYIFGLGKYITVTPDIQFYINPALDQEQSTATVVSLRFGLSI